MFAIIAAIIFAVAWCLRLFGVEVDTFLFLYPGLFFLALHMVRPVAIWRN